MPSQEKRLDPDEERCGALSALLRLFVPAGAERDDGFMVVVQWSQLMRRDGVVWCGSCVIRTIDR